MRFHIIMLINTLRRFAVNWLLGKDLILQKIEAPSGNKIELIDMKWRLNFGKWDVTPINNRDFRLTR